MKHFKMKQLIFRGLVFVSLFPAICRAAPIHIEKLLTAIEKKESTISNPLQQHTQAFEEMIKDFLSQNNCEAYQTHVQRLKRAIQNLDALLKQYNMHTNAAAKILIKELHSLTQELNQLTPKPTQLALISVLQNYKHLIPQTIYKNYGASKLSEAINHRIKCSTPNTTTTVSA